ncbi:MAG: hypothetical protein JNJ97_05500 [Alphaproteobacteria bacterium]|nr:hypothetical protein [Alphaproteobacteria bacterium]MCA0449027.1 hypothetical protein [Pseudomonadota bacterium]
MIRLARLLFLCAALAFAPSAYAEDAKGEGAHGPETGKFVLPRVIVAAIKGDRVLRHYALLMRLELATPADEDKIKSNLPRLQDAFILDLNEVAAHGETFDQERAKRRMMASSTRILGDAHIVTDVVFERVLERKVPAN